MQGTPFDKAVWEAWDLTLGADKVSKYDSFVGQAGDAIFAYDDATNDFNRVEKAERALVTLKRQTRKWRLAYNLKIDGREIDIPRMVKDLGDTQKRVLQIKKTLEGFQRDAKDQLNARRKKDFKDAFRVTDMAVRALQKAQELGIEEAASPSPGRVASRFTQRR